MPRKEHSTDELNSLINIVWNRGSNAYKNHFALVEFLKKNSNTTALAQHKVFLGKLEELGARNLKELPRITRKGHYDAGLYEKIGTSDTTGKWLRWGNDLDLYFWGRRPTHTEKDYLRVSNDNYAELMVLAEALTMPPKEFKKSLKPRASEYRRKEKEKELEELVKEGIAALPERLQGKLRELVEISEIGSIAELIRYIPELRVADKEGLKYKAYAGNVVNRLYNMLINEEIDAPNALIAVRRIREQYLRADKADWIIVFACAAQSIKEQINAVFGREKKDIEYALEHDIGYKIGLDKEFKPLWWYKELSQPKAITIGEALKHERTRAEVEGLKRALSGFWESRIKYIRNNIKNYFGSAELKQLAGDMWGVYTKDREHIAKAQQAKQPENPTLSKKAYRLFDHFYEMIEYRWYEASDRERKGSIQDWLIQLLSIGEAIEMAPQLYVEWKKYLLAEHTKDKTKARGILHGRYKPIAGMEDKLKLMADKIRYSYMIPSGHNTDYEKWLCMAVGLKSSRIFHQVQANISEIREELEFGIIAQEHAGEKSQFERAYRIVEDYKEVDSNLRSKIEFIISLNRLGLETKNIKADSGSIARLKKEQRFSIYNFKDARYVSEAQFKTIEHIYNILTEDPEIKKLEDKSELEKIVKLKDFVKKLKDGVVFEQEGKKGLCPSHISIATPYFDIRKGVWIDKPKEIIHLYEEYEKLSEDLRYKIGKIVNAMPYLSSIGVVCQPSKILDLAEEIKNNPETVFLEKGLVKEINKAYEQRKI